MTVFIGTMQLSVSSVSAVQFFWHCLLILMLDSLYQKLNIHLSVEVHILTPANLRNWWGTCASTCAHVDDTVISLRHLVLCHSAQHSHMLILCETASFTTLCCESVQRHSHSSTHQFSSEDDRVVAESSETASEHKQQKERAEWDEFFCDWDGD